ncbi:hypothetical protein GCM10007874_44670 [Labrys miyagiensis]|uniref:Sulfocyanin-like C-terminal domain-containing protein n=1 Tax=Labrys miyagiensis TaxID=346912 RepID=A0ABQ6CNR4_9HYPH|nr:sulfocyanin-like copper-binding protein [Labrys miyagiensis]GLS21450.1 hypothetical protein GCM10007874_44670 [Labrys miyagiensis]
MAAGKMYLGQLATCLALAFPLNAASAASIVKVELWDKGAETPMATDMAFAKSGSDPSKATMGMRLSRSSVPAGIVIFQVKNSSKDTVHEMIVMYLADPTKPLPYIDKDSKVDEDKAGDKGEVSELEPGKSGSLQVPLKAGKYLLICNVTGHFAAGMWTQFEVTK